MPEKPPSVMDPDLLHELTGQTEVSEPDHARALLGVAQQEEAEARQEYERSRWPLRRARFRMLPVRMRVPPLVAALVLSSVLIFVVATLMIMVHLAGAVELIALISVGYTLGFGAILYLLNDGTGENDENRATVRRRELEAALDARAAAAAKVARLQRQTMARQQLLAGVITARYESMRRRREKPPASKETRPSTATEPGEPEYGGG